MTGIRPHSLGKLGQVALTADARAWIARGCCARALLSFALSAVGCTFDATPRTVARDDAGSTAKWMPPSVARRNGVITQRTQKSDAESSTDSISSDDAGMRGRDADASGKMADAGQPSQQPAKRDAAPSAGNTAGSASSMESVEVRDASAPPVTMPDMSRQCMPGIYEGNFEGPVTFVVGTINSVSGTMRAELALDPSGGYLQVREGMMVGQDSAGLGMSAQWTGRLNCGTKLLENGRHEAGAWENGSRFTGTLEGTYSVNPASMSGTWMVQSEEILLAGGNGTWRMTLRDSPAP